MSADVEFERAVVAHPAGPSVVADEVARRSRAWLSDSAAANEVALALWLLLRAREEGSSCLDLRAMAGQSLSEDVRLPEFEPWVAALDRSDVVVALSPAEVEPAPAALMVRRESLLYLRRDDEVERQVARGLVERTAAEGASTASSADPEGGEEVARVIELLGRSNLALVTGGPGTGKTTAVRAVLEALKQGQPELRVLLAAPTGKAAARLAQSLGELSTEGVHTLHRVLGLRPGRVEREPATLDCDLLVIDEASMVGLHLMHEVLRRLRASTKLLLVGDAGQLASVEAGSVLADLHAVALEEAAPPAVRQCLVEFKRNWRFEAQPGISELAVALRAGDAAKATEVLDGRFDDVVHHEWESGMRSVVDGAVSAWQRATEMQDPDQAAAVLRDTRVLCALREGPVGVGGITRRIESRLRTFGVDPRVPFYLGRPVLVTENAPRVDLANGDVGILWNDRGRPVALVDGRAGELRRIDLAQMPAWVDAWAMTVHKSQGSEFDEVWLVLPPENHPLATRELIYTAVTRARRRLHVVGSLPSLAACCRRGQRRASGLAGRLKGQWS